MEKVTHSAANAHDETLPEVKKELSHQSPARGTAFKALFNSPWVPYIIAVCLMLIGMGQIKLILGLQSQLLAARSEASTLRASNELMQLHLVTLEAKDPSYVSARVLLAWDPHMHRGTLSLEHLPLPPSGHDYQLWVLDPTAETPINAGVITVDAASHRFAVHAVNTDSPGFAISLEPAGGRPIPTVGSILFAVAPDPE